MSTEASEEKSHGHGDHWGCFAENVSEFIKGYLPMTIDKGSLLKMESEDGEFMTSTSRESSQYPVGIYWPSENLRFLTLIMIDKGAERNELWSAYPWSVSGVQHSLSIEKVIPWSNGIEGQIKVLVDDAASITFFDTLYYLNHPTYREEQSFLFSLAGFAYKFSVIDPEPVSIKNPETIRRLRSMGFGESKPKYEAAGEPETIIVETKGMAIFFQLDGWDDDDYSFRAPVVEVEEMEFLNEPLWRVRATVLRIEQEFNLDIFVTTKVMGEGQAPKPGDDIEGALWLQGYLVKGD